MIRILSTSEMEELVEHLKARPDIWLEHAGAWIRRQGRERTRCRTCRGHGHDEFHVLCTACKGSRYEPDPQELNKGDFALALRVRNGLEENLCSITAAPLGWSQSATEDYLVWLLNQYTNYETRSRVRAMLSSQVRPAVNIEALSRDVIEALEQGRKNISHDRRKAP